MDGPVALPSGDSAHSRFGVRGTEVELAWCNFSTPAARHRSQSMTVGFYIMNSIHDKSVFDTLCLGMLTCNAIFGSLTCGLTW